MSQNTLSDDNEKLLSILKNKEVKGLEEWLDAGGNPDTVIANPGFEGDSLLNWLVMDIDEPKDDTAIYEMMVLLIKHRADVNLVVKSDGYSNLHWVVAENRLAMANILLEAGANVDTRTDEGMTPILLAMENESWKLFELLVHYATREAINKWGSFHGNTPLGLAVREGNFWAIDLLLRHGADPDAYEPDYGQAKNNLRFVDEVKLREKIRMLLERYDR